MKIKIIIIVIIVVALGFVFIKKHKTSTPENVDQVAVDSAVDSMAPTEDVVKEETKPVVTKPIDNTPVSYSNDQLGFSFTYPKSLGTFELTLENLGAGKSIDGQMCGDVFCMYVGGVTPDTFTQNGAYGLSHYPTETELADLNDTGYKTETKLNSNGASYLIIHGKKDDNYIGENQAVVVFKLPTPPNFNVVGFMLASGDMKTFLKIIDSVKVY